jgi:di/tricarboxylate transporter
MTIEIAIVFLIILLALVMFIWERFSVDTVAILVMICFMATGILTPAEGFSGFSNPATLTVGAMFVISAAVFKSGILNNVGNLLFKAGKVNFTLALLLLLVISGLLSAFINDTAVVALFMPVVIKLAKDLDISPSKLLMPLSFGALMGGICTLIGTSTNILVSGIAAENGLPPFSMFEMTKGGVFFLLAGILYIVFIGQHLLPKHPAVQDPTDDFEMGNYLAEIKLLAGAKSIGTTIGESPIMKEVDIEILQIIREEGKVEFPMPGTVLLEGDRLKVRCDVEKLKKLATRQGIKIKGNVMPENDKNFSLYEALVTPNSPMVGKSLAELQFMDTYKGASILAIRSRKNIVHEKLGKVPLKSGDVLLLRSTRQLIHYFKKNGYLLIISEIERRKLDLRRILLTLLIVVSIILSSALGYLPILLSAAIGVILLVLFRLLKPEEAYKAIDWKVIFMLAGILSMGTALQKTGAAELLSNFISQSLGQFGPEVVLGFFFLITFLLTNFMSNNATAALLAPVAISTANMMGVSSRPLLMAVTFAASLSFMTPLGYQTNTMIYAPGNYKFMDYLKVGTPLNFILWLLAIYILPKLYPF